MVTRSRNSLAGGGAYIMGPVDDQFQRGSKFLNKGFNVG